jgi:hypothetical protein
MPPKSTYTPERLQPILDRMSRGEPLARICRDEGMPDDDTVRDWGKANPDVERAIARARDRGEDAIAADCLEIADDSGGDYRMGEKGLIADTDHIQRAKLRIETRLKLLAKWNPKKWGDKIEVENKVNMAVSVTIQRLTDGPADPVVGAPHTGMSQRDSMAIHGDQGGDA